MMKKINTLKLSLTGLVGGILFSATAVADELWQVIEMEQYEARYSYEHNLEEQELQKYLGETEQIKSLLENIKYGGSEVITLPLPNGKIIAFELTYDQIMSPELADEYPNLMTFSGVSKDDSKTTGRFDLTPEGFHGMFGYEGKTVYVDPDKDKPGTYKSYYASAVKSELKEEYDHDDLLLNPNRSGYIEGLSQKIVSKGAGIIRNYRIIITAASSYTDIHGGTKAKAQAEIVTAINRVNDIYQKDMGIKLTLVNTNIYTQASPESYANAKDGVLLKAHHDDLVAKFGEHSFDIGHLFGVGDGGLAYAGVVCDADYKGQATTSLDNPKGDNFYIDYLAHEIGHQFGANHTFNGTQMACSGSNRHDATAVEPGSATTIMGYAGNCLDDDIQPNSDAMFHSVTIDEINQFLNTVNCGTTTTSGNQIPAVDAGKDYFVPERTPLMLSGTATDQDSGDVLSYSWEQMDAGTGESNLSYDPGKGPLFRAWLPQNTGVRHLPRLQDQIKGSISKGETYATTSRVMNFRLTARDQKGGVAHDDMKINVTDKAGPFKVVFPTQKTPAAYKTYVEWAVAGTNVAPVNCANVDILMSTDGGVTFNNRLLSGTKNDGKEQVSFPAKDTSNAMLMIKCSDNIFYALSQKFDVTSSGNAGDPTPPSQNTPSIASKKGGGSLSLVGGMMLLLISIVRRKR